MTVLGGIADGKEVSGQLLRLAMMAVLNSNVGSLSCDGGVRFNSADPDAMKVIPGSSGLSVVVKPGMCVIPGTELTAQGPYLLANDANKTITLSPASGGQARYDRIVAVVDDNGDETTSYDISAVTGTPAGSPTLPSIPANALKLGAILVPALADGPEDLTITDERSQIGAFGRTFQNLAFVPASTFSPPEHITTSSSFVGLEMTRIYVQYATLYMEVLVISTDADTTGEVRINVNGTIMGATQAVAGSTYTRYTFGPTRLPGFGTTINLASTIEIYVEARRIAGAGNIGVRTLLAQLRPL
jgi:hypothetical protein